MIALGLTVPYWIFKSIFALAHLRNPREPQPHLRDLPKYRDEL